MDSPAAVFPVAGGPVSWAAGTPCGLAASRGAAEGLASRATMDADLLPSLTRLRLEPVPTQGQPS
jgi:hypothetical protein